MYDVAKSGLGRRTVTNESVNNNNINNNNNNSNNKMIYKDSTQAHKSSSSQSVLVDICEREGPVKSLSLIHMLKLNAIVGGLEFCGSAAFCFIPPMLLKAGIDEQNMSMVLGVGPLMSLIFVPVIGRWSDSCESSYGRRRPYIFVISIILILSMLILLSAHYIGKVLVGGGDTGRLTTTTLLILGCAFLDFTYQICLTPCEALFSDLCDGTDQHHCIFTVYSFIISFGGCIGYLITALDWSDFGFYFGSQENCVFIILILMFSVTMVITLCSANEIPLRKIDKLVTASKSEVHFYPDVPIHEFKGISEKSKANGGWRYQLNSCQMLLVEILVQIKNFKNFVILTLSSILPVVILQIFTIPQTLKQLALANLFSWAAINTFNLFYTDYIGRIIYQGNPYDSEGSIGRNSYDEGLRMASWGLFFHCIVSAFYAPFIHRIIRIFNLQTTYFIGMASFFVAMSLMTLSHNIFFTNVCASITGIGYATLTTVPFLLLTSYHSHLELYFGDTHNGHLIPSRGIGSDLSVLDSAYFLSQVILSLCMGHIVKVTGTVLSYIVTSVCFSILSLYYICKIVHQPEKIVFERFNKNIQ